MTEERSRAEQPAIKIGKGVELWAAATILRTIRAHVGLNQRELAAGSGLSVSTIGRIESGAHSRPTWHSILRCLQAGGLRLALVDAEGRVIQLTQFELDRDRAGRHYPAHLHVWRVVKPWQWWGTMRQARLVDLSECPRYTYSLWSRRRPEHADRYEYPDNA